MFDEKGQASIEVLLLIAGAVVVAIAVGLYIKSASESIANQANEVSHNVYHDIG